MKKMIVIALSSILVLSFVACEKNDSVNSDAAKKSNQIQGLGSSDTQIANPFEDCETLEDAVKLAEFDITVPEKMPEGYSQSGIRAAKDTMINIGYSNENSVIDIRKGSGKDDISGDYNEYAETNTVIIGDIQVTMKGNDGLVNVATWVNGDYSYAITISEAGMDSTVISDMVSSIQ